MSARDDGWEGKWEAENDLLACRASEPISDYGRDLRELANAVNRATRWKFCLTCRAAISPEDAAKYGGRCAAHRDEQSDTDRKGCPECGGTGRHSRNCPYVE